MNMYTHKDNYVYTLCVYIYIYTTDQKNKKMNIENLIFASPAWQKTLVRKTEKENKKFERKPATNLYEYIYIYTKVYPQLIPAVVFRCIII